MAEPEKKASSDRVHGLLSSLQEVMMAVQNLAVTGADEIRRGVFPQGTGLHGVYGFTLKADLERPALHVEPFGNMQTNAAGQAVVSDIIEPRTEVLPEGDFIIISAEMPGIGSEDVRLAISGSTLTINAERGRRKFRKELTLPADANAETMSFSCKDGLLEVRMAKVK